MKFTQNAKTVLERRYLAKDNDGKVIETIEELFTRVASTVAGADAAYGKSEEEIKNTENEFYQMMTDCEFMPNSPTLMNAGRPLGQLSACFVLPVEDSMVGIFDTVKYAALVHQSGGGTGFSFSRLRPEGSIVKSTGGTSSGPVSFMKVFNAATEAVKQGGTRRGANMGMLRIDHPDILKFIDCKANNNEINNFNISVAITDKFMEAVENGTEYELVAPHTGEVTGTLDAREVFEKIVDAAWRNGEPGIVFIDEMNRYNPTPALGEIESTNPCGEQPLLPYEACNLGSINLGRCVVEEDGILSIDYDKITDVVHKAVHFLDNVIDVNHYPLPAIDEMTRKTRKIGLGVMGFADLLLKLGVPYNSVEAERVAEEVMSLIQSEGTKASIELALERGTFPAWEDSVFADRYEIRNATITTIAPTGTISIIADASGGCEPLFAYAFTKNVMDGDKLLVCNDLLVEKLKERGIYSEELIQRIADEGTLAHIEEIPEDIRRVFVCAHDITPEWHIRIQAAFQKYTDNAVSKTINFPNSATREEVKEAYVLAHKLGCKGTTVYRDGSRDSQVLTIGTQKKEEEQKPEVSAVPNSILPRPRPNLTWGATEKMKIGCGSLFITVNRDEHGICEVFTSTGKGGGCPSQSEATARLVSIALRAGISQDEILAQLKGIRCPSTVRQPGLKCTSCPDAIARTIVKMSKMLGTNGFSVEPEEEPTPKKAEGAKTAPANKPVLGKDDKLHCPECGKLLRHEGGCTICDCGFSHCG